MDCLSDAELLEDRSVRSAVLCDSAVSDQRCVAEITRVPSARAVQQLARSHNRLLRLPVAIVDYLLEHEWFSLLAGYGRRCSGQRREHGGPRSSVQAAPADDGSILLDESNRTTSVDESASYLVTLFDQPRAPSWTTTTEE
jgi:hypothetical protein